ncbi:hypothetical protein HG531_001369 [Fusarium graminearum]|nr:hypothetical protein HG531_001369 [Fusarium graminearum]
MIRACSDDIGGERFMVDIPSGQVLVPIKQDTSVVDQNIKVAIFLLDVRNCFIDRLRGSEVEFDDIYFVSLAAKIRGDLFTGFGVADTEKDMVVVLGSKFFGDCKTDALS